MKSKPSLSYNTSFYKLEFFLCKNLDRDGKTEEETSERPAVISEGVEGRIQEQHTDGIVEQPNNGNIFK